jgi:hypothetical protein
MTVVLSLAESVKQIRDEGRNTALLSPYFGMNAVHGFSRISEIFEFFEQASLLIG